MSDVPKCTSWMGHKFKGRYETSFPPMLSEIKSASTSALEALRQQTYVHDICVRCGHVVSPPKKDRAGQ